jgi:hypothetical protein
MQLLPDVRPKASPNSQHDVAAAKQLVTEIEGERSAGAMAEGRQGGNAVSPPKIGGVLFDADR